MSVARGETVGIVGSSGRGKTTLALILCGLMDFDAGEIVFQGVSIRSGNRKAWKPLRSRIQIVWQHPETAFNPRWKMRRSLLEPFRLHGIPVSEEFLEQMPAQVELGIDVLERRPDCLSGGELQRLAIGRALASKPRLLILDEPTSMLDTVTQARILHLLKEIQRATGISYIFVSHDHRLVRLFSDRALALEDGILREFSMEREVSG